MNSAACCTSGPAARTTSSVLRWFIPTWIEHQKKDVLRNNLSLVLCGEQPQGEEGMKASMDGLHVVSI